MLFYLIDQRVTLKLHLVTGKHVVPNHFRKDISKFYVESRRSFALLTRNITQKPKRLCQKYIRKYTFESKRKIIRINRARDTFRKILLL